MAEVGSAFVSILPSARGFGRELDSQVGGEVDSSGKRAGSRFGTALKAGALAVAGGAALLGGFLKGSLDEAREAQKVGALTNAVIKSTGGVANVTAGQVNRLATSISLKTGIDDEAIASGENMLLTFSNVRNEVGRGNDIFNQATVAATDMAAAFGGDAVSNSKMLGKALNDPVKGVSALTRVGVSFTQQQKDQIATMVAAGDTLGAQKVILGELSKQTAGAAEAQATAGDKFRVAFGNMQESVGTALLPLFDRVLEAGTKLAVILTNNVGPGIAALNGYIAPVVAQVQSFFQQLAAGGGAGNFLASLVPIFLNVRSTVTGLVAAFVPFVQSVMPSLVAAGQRIAAALVPALTTITGIIANQLVPAFRAILPVLAPIVSFLVGVFAGAVVGAINGVVQTIKGVVGVIAGVVNLVKALIHGDWAAAWAALKQIVVGAFNAVVGAVRTYLNIGILRLFGVAAGLLRGIWAGLWGSLRGAAQAGVGALRGMVSAFFGFIRNLFVRGVQTYIGLWRGLFNILRSAASAGWAAIRGAFSSALAAIRSAVSSGMNAVKNFFSSAWNAIKSGVTNAFNAIKSAVSNGINAVVNLVQGIPGKVRSALGDLGSALFNSGAELIQGLINGITSKISAVTSKMSELASKVKGFLPGSPVREGPLKAWNNTGPTGPGGQLVGMLAKGMGNVNPIQTASKELAQAISENFTTDTFAQNFTLQGAVTSLKADARRASEFSKAARRAKKLGLDGGVMTSLMESGNTALLQDITSTRDVQALERAWRQRNKATDFFDEDEAKRLRHEKRLEDAVERGARKGTEGKSKRDRNDRKSRTRRAMAP